MYVLTIVNDWEARFETKVFPDDVNVLEILRDVTTETVDAIRGLCRADTDIDVYEHIEGRLDSMYPEYVHESLDGLDRPLAVDYFTLMTMIHDAPEEIDGALEALELDVDRGFLKILQQDENTFIEKSADFQTMLCNGFISWSISNDIHAKYEVYFMTLRDKDAFAGPRVNIKLEHKDTYDTLD